MTERWGVCRGCSGRGLVKDPVLFTEKECASCNGEGYDGSAEAYAELEDQWERERAYMERGE